VELSCDNSQESLVLLAPINILEKSRFREGIDRLGHNQMIEDANVDKPKGFPETSGDELVRGAGLGEARRMIVIQRDVRSH
jgi:hypothetical protein